jgi:hypothetical protein
VGAPPGVTSQHDVVGSPALGVQLVFLVIASGSGPRSAAMAAAAYAARTRSRISFAGSVMRRPSIDVYRWDHPAAHIDARQYDG